ncbi:MAG: DUF1015 family protein [Myxococcales bacterium]|nr:MAG: DUF1015 family protein [Myxococcales bacterium]
MAKLEALNAVVFANAQNGTEISGQICPPYDVLDEGPKAKLLAADPHNIVAVDLPVTPPKTLGPDSAYDNAAQLYRQWIEEKSLSTITTPLFLSMNNDLRSQAEVMSAADLSAH